MANYKAVFGNYLKAEDLQGKAVRITIERVELEDFKSSDGKAERKLVVHFSGKEKGLVLNRTNADTLAEIFGDQDYDNWVGPVVLFPDMTTFGGKRVPCIRIKAATAPKRVEPEPELIDEDSVPF